MSKRPTLATGTTAFRYSVVKFSLKLGHLIRFQLARRSVVVSTEINPVDLRSTSSRNFRHEL
ncbi:MAG: hypothetical protein ACE5KV_07375 [Thermoplasmata archaeon]